MSNHKIYTKQEIQSLPKIISLMPPCIIKVNGHRTAVIAGLDLYWLKIADDVTYEDLEKIWQKWEPQKSQDQLKLEKLNKQVWEIASSNGKSKYTVTLDNGIFSCTCVGFGYHRRCKHIQQVKDQLIN